ncbi:hypothetical protein CPB86DRAFT_802135 [Serendipita vermifera]|nr:hypothetical protein CPB86DRAFT_802135 [Serendipita vermifera]
MGPISELAGKVYASIAQSLSRATLWAPATQDFNDANGNKGQQRGQIWISAQFHVAAMSWQQSFFLLFLSWERNLQRPQSFGCHLGILMFNVTGDQPNLSNAPGNPPWPGYSVYNHAYGGAVIDKTLVMLWVPDIKDLIEEVSDFLAWGAPGKSLYPNWQSHNAVFAFWKGINNILTPFADAIEVTTLLYNTVALFTKLLDNPQVYGFANEMGYRDVDDLIWYSNYLSKGQLLYCKGHQVVKGEVYLGIYTM